MLDPEVSLATAMHSQPGVYALLLGSGVSTGAGVPTGWGITTALIRDLAAAHAPEDPQAADTAASDPEGWWLAHGDGAALGYSNLLAAVAPTSGGRRDVLSSFFQPTEEELAEGLKAPGAAHRGMAELIRRAAVRVVVTTNFDRLLERALEDVGVSPQVISSPGAVDGMTPLAHAACTIIKLHGDVADLEQRNTIDELSAYPESIDRLLDQVFDDYGLVVSGWSADWDVALVAALERARRRRYPLYWCTRSRLSEPAQRLVGHHTAVVVNGVSADTFFPSLVERLQALDRLTDAPLTRAMAVVRLKKLLPDPTRHIDVHDLLMDEVDKISEHLRERPQVPPTPTGEAFQAEYERLESSTDTLLHLLGTGVYFDRDRLHTGTWVRAIRRLLQTRRQPDGTFNQSWDALQHYPALLALRVAGTAAVMTGRDDVLLRLFREPTWRDPFNAGAGPKPAVEVLHEYRVLAGDVINSFPKYDSKWLYPPSHHLREVLKPVLEPHEPSPAAYTEATDGYEFRVALAQWMNEQSRWSAVPGEFILDGRWRRDPEMLAAEGAFRESGDLAAWGLEDEWGSRSEKVLDEALVPLREQLKQHRRWG